jgi:hypothetical protein
MSLRKFVWLVMVAGGLCPQVFAVITGSYLISHKHLGRASPPGQPALVELWKLDTPNRPTDPFSLVHQFSQALSLPAG